MLTITQKQHRNSCAAKVTIVEVLWMVLLIGGGVIGGRVGYGQFGLLSAMIGLLLGLATGLFISCGIGFLFKALLSKRRDAKH